MTNSASIQAHKICRVCENKLGREQVAYCSSVCRGLARGTSTVDRGDYWGITPKNQFKGIEIRYKRNY